MMFESNRKPIDLLNIYFKIGGCFGIFPILMKKKYIYWFDVLARGILNIKFAHATYVYLNFTYLTIENCLAFITCSIYNGSTFLFLYQMIKNRSSWKILLKCLTSIENEIHHNQLNVKKAIVTLCVMVILSAFMSYFTITFENHYNFETIVIITEWLLIHFQMLIIVFCVVELSSNITKIHQYLYTQISCEFSKYSISKNALTCKLYNIKFVYSNLCKVTDQFNEIFGALISVFFLIAFLQMLFLTNWIVNFCSIDELKVIYMLPYEHILFVSNRF